MAKTTAKGTAVLSIDVAPSPADVGTEVTITARVVCDPPCELTGDTLQIRDADGTALATLAFTEFDEETETSVGSVSVRVPDTVGGFAWTAVLEAFAADDLEFDAVTAPVSITVKAHTTKINVWGAPTAIGLGEQFGLKVGVKCTCSCSLAGQPFTIHDETGAERAAGTLGDGTWPRTDALYFAEPELTAPASAVLGNHTWSVRFPAEALKVPHAASTTEFGVTFVPAPEHVVTVEAVDSKNQTPLVGAIVSMHPYRAVTDERGIAELRVPKGGYTLFVSARKYVSDSASVEVTGDLRTQAHLAVEVRPERL